MNDYDYISKREHWTAFAPGMGRTRETAFVVEVDDRAATRQAIIDRLRKRGFTFVERWAWHARQPREILSKKGELETIKDEDIWDYKDIVIHHAGHSYRCAMTSRQSFEEVQRVQDEDMKRFFDIAYHYAVSCTGEIFEARDIRHRGEHVGEGNTGKIGVVMLQNLAESGEAWTNEYSNKSAWDILWHWRDVITDLRNFPIDRPTNSQSASITVLVDTLLKYFNIAALGGHREYQLLANGQGRACPGKYGMELVNKLRAKFGLKVPS